MKIVFATHEGVPLYGGGPDIKIKALKSHLEQLGVQVELFDLWNARKQLSSCDLVHLFGGNFAVYNLARNLRYQKIPFVVNPIFFSRKSAMTINIISRIDKITRRFIPGMWWEWGFTRDICHWAKAIFPNTKAEGDLLSQAFRLPPEKVTVIHNGVSKHFRKATPDEFIAKYGMKDFILHVGHVGPTRKNMLTFVKALQSIDHPVVLIERILDTGETQEVLELISRMPHVKLIKGLPNDSSLLASAYAAAKVFVLPSIFETPGRAALEAALAGANIAITPYGGTREYFGDFATYINPNSVESIRNGIKLLLQQPVSPLLAEHIEKNFTWGPIAQQTLICYNTTLAKCSI
jgi:glycosyltransferase involved in cell wall biosynthesis